MEKRKNSQKEITSFFAKKRKDAAEDENNNLHKPVEDAGPSGTKKNNDNMPNPSVEAESDFFEQVAEVSVGISVPGISQKGDEQPFLSVYDDIGLYDRSKLTDIEKMKLIKNQFRHPNDKIFPKRDGKKT